MSVRTVRIVLLLPFVLLVTGTYALHTPLPEATPVRGMVPPDGEALYNEKCMACHQYDGTGIPGVFPPLAETDWVTGPEERLVRIVLHGVEGKMEVAGMTYSGNMPPWGGFLNDEELAALVSYVRTSFGNDASTVEPARVAAIREATADRKKPWTAEELLQIGAPAVADSTGSQK